MKHCIQYTYQATSRQEAEMVANGLRPLERCIDVRVYTWSVTAHFDCTIPPEALPEGCHIVPESVVRFIQRIHNVGE